MKIRLHPAARRPLALAGLLLSAVLSPASSFQEDGNGFVFFEAEDFDLNVTQENGFWEFDNTPLDFDAFSGWGYVTAFSSGGTDTNTNPHLDYTVNFASAGPHYIWVAGSDAGGKSIDVGLDGVVSSTSSDLGGPDGSFGARYGGQILWVGTNNTGGGFTNKAYLNVPTAGPHTVNLFIREAGLLVDWVLLTTNIDYAPGPYPNPSNLPGETLAPSAGLAVALTQPAPGKSISSNALVVLSAKPTAGAAAISKVEFYESLLPSGAKVKLGEATAEPYQIGWVNPVAGNYALTARVIDAGSATATSSVVNVSIYLPSGYLTPLRWETNTFDAGLGSFTLLSQNQSGGFNFGWSATANAGGPAGELGGYVVRSFDVVPYVGEPLLRRVSLNEELWFTGTIAFSNLNANGDTFLGYFDSSSSTHPRVGLKVREPTSSGGLWRFSVEPNGVKINSTLANNTPASFELHWTPTGLGDGSGTLTGSVAGLPFTADYSATPNSSTFDAFGWLAPSQGSTDVTRSYYEYFDNLAYRVPSSQRLNIQSIGGGRVVLSWAIDGYTLQYNTNSAAGSAWWDSTDPVSQSGDTYWVTNTVGAGLRWYRLRHGL